MAVAFKLIVSIIMLSIFKVMPFHPVPLVVRRVAERYRYIAYLLVIAIRSTASDFTIVVRAVFEKHLEDPSV